MDDVVTDLELDEAAFLFQRLCHLAIPAYYMISKERVMLLDHHSMLSKHSRGESARNI
jgi:hypothetical protein